MQNYCEVCAKRVNLGDTITVQFIVTISFFLLKVSDNYWSCTFFCLHSNNIHLRLNLQYTHSLSKR